MRHLSRFQKLLVALFLAAVFFAAWNQLKESDSFYHLKTGQVIWETQSVPRTDIFSSTAHGVPWVTHEWLAALLFYGAYSLGGLAGSPQAGFAALTAFVAALAALTYALLFLTALRRFSPQTGGGANVYVTLAVAAALGALTFELWIPRPQVFAFFACALLLFFLEGFRRRAAGEVAQGGQGGSARMLVGAVLTIWFWANVHASVLLGLVLMLIYTLLETLKLRWPHLGEALPRGAARLLALATGAAIAVSFLNPNSYDIFLYRFYVTQGVEQLGVLEWKSIFDFLYQWQAIVFLALLAVSLAVVAWWRWRRESRDATPLVVLAAVACLPLLSIRHVGWWPLVAVPPVALVLSGAGEKLLRRVSPRALRRGFFAGLAVWLFFLMLHIPKNFVRRDLLPVGVADFILANDIRGPIFNLYNEGGYLIWRLWPKILVFVDGRSEVFGGTPLADLVRIVKRGREWDTVLLGKYGVNLAILPYQPESLSRDTGPLSFELGRRGFHLVYWDDVAMLLVRETLENGDFIGTYRFASIHPLRDPKMIPLEERRQAGLEIQALLARAPESRNVQQYAKDFLRGAAGE
ncbi:MAG: hypothetical protein HYY10_01550 [Candidatus Liptonbacteria bacterium]|nr:hypothetical protein [Candidatus Liptonbacteria bacterium]